MRSFVPRRSPFFYWIILIVALTGLAPVAILLAVSYYHAIHRTQTWLERSIDRSVQRTDHLLKTADTLLTRIAADTEGKPSPEAFNLIRRTVYNDPRFREAGLINEQGTLVLTSLGPVNPPVAVPPQERANPDRRSLQVLGPTQTAVMRERSIVLSLPTQGQGEVNLLVDPIVFTYFLDDVELGSEGFIAFFRQNGQLVTGLGSLPDERLDHLSVANHQNQQTPGWQRFLPLPTQPIQVTRSTRNQEMTIVGKVPLQWVLRYWWRDLMIGVPVALLCSGLFITLLIQLARRTYGIEHDIRMGLTNHEFVVYYQPIIDLSTQQCAGSEALVRWLHPDLGLISPTVFIPIAEKTGLIRPLSEWIVHQVLQDQADVLRQADLYVSLNLPPALLNSTDFLDYITQTLATAPFSAQQILFEVTENSLMDVGYAEKISRLRGLGFRLALDDFGTGYSNLDYLDKFEFDYLKIDRCFVQRIESLDTPNPIVHTLIDLGQTLGLEIVAEGVETDIQRHFLHQSGVRYVQGWLFAKAMPLEQFRQFLREMPLL